MASDLHHFIAVNALAVVSIVLICLGISGLLKSLRVDRYFPGSAAAIVIGFIAGAILNFTGSNVQDAFAFSPYLFFFLLLPPIMIEAGYTLRRKRFFKNFSMICIYAFAGTFVTCIAFGGLLFVFAQAGIIPLNSFVECLMFGALISATDPVAVLAMLNSPDVNVPPLLHSLIFGESILNDAIAIVLFQTFEGLIPSHCIVDEHDPHAAPSDCAPVDFTVVTFFTSFGKFVGITVGSIVVGFAVALIAGFISRRVQLEKYTSYEVTLVVLFSWLSYFLAEAVYLSGIMSIFFTAVGLAHYTYYNISEGAQHATHDFFQSVAQMAETFVFAYIGICVGLSIQGKPLDWNVAMIFISIFATFVSRACHIFPLTFVANCFREDKIPFAMQIPVWWAGLRGAVAVALSLDFPLYYRDTDFIDHRGFVVTSTLGIVLTTTLLCGGTTVSVLNMTNMNRSAPEDDEGGQYVMERDEEEFDEFDEHGNYHNPNEQYGGLINRWRTFDRTFMRRWFGGNPASSLLPEDQKDSNTLLQTSSLNPRNGRPSEVALTSRGFSSGNRSRASSTTESLNGFEF